MGRKVKFVLSDLHIGVNATQNNPSHIKAFTPDNLFADFLKKIAEESETKGYDVELIINGDFLEFLRVPAVDDFDPSQNYPDEYYLDTSDEASIKRLKLIHSHHPTVFQALSDFMCPEQPQRRITLIKGDRDVHFYWPRVKGQLRALLQASGARSSLLLFAEEFVSREKIYIEHGHQHAETFNKYLDFHDPRQTSVPGQLDYPPASRLLIDLDRDNTIASAVLQHVQPITALVWPAVKWNQRLAAKLLTKLAPPVPISVALETSLEFIEFQDETVCYEALLQCQTDVEYRHNFYQQIERYLSQFHPTPKPTNGLDEITDHPLEMIRKEQARQHQWLRQAAQRIAYQEGAQIILFGHAHRPAQETLENDAIYVNTGSWAEDFSTASLETWQALLTGTVPADTLSVSLPYARIDYYEDKDTPSVQLLDFARKEPPKSYAKADLSERVINWINRLRS